MIRLERASTRNRHRMVANIATVLNVAADDEWADGLAWYDQAHSVARSLAATYECTIRTAAGIIAATSPLQQWERNVELAEQVLATTRRPTGLLVRSYTNANTIKHGLHPLDVLSGAKTRAFYRNIVQPWRETDVCIDRHAFAAVMGRPLDDKQQKQLERAGVYALVSDAYRAAASTHNVTAHQAQAITWVAWRNRLRNRHTEVAIP